MSFQKKIKALLPPGFLDFLRYLKYRFLFKSKFSLNQKIDNKLEKYLDYNNGFYVELGANDGFTQSNTFFLELKRGWSGILIEPSLNLFEKCCYYRKNNFLHCNACVPFSYKKNFVNIEYSHDSGLTSVSTDLNSDLPDKEKFIESWKKRTSKNLRKIRFGAYAKTLNDILDESKAPYTIDFLSLDVEGSELDVLKGVNFSKYEFKFMLIECRDIKKMSKYLKKFNYSLIDKLTHHDYLFKKIQS